jgi:hypothetical protein
MSVAAIPATIIVAMVSARMNSDAEAHDGRPGIDDARRRSRNVDYARRAFHIHDLRRSLDHLRGWLINNRGIRDDRCVRYHGSLDNRRAGLRAVDLLAINRLLIDSGSLINRRRSRIDWFLRLEGRADQSTCRRADDGTLRPTITVVTANQSTRDSAHRRATTDGRPKDLRVGRTDRGNRKRYRDEKCFHFDAETIPPGAVFSQICSQKNIFLGNISPASV